MHRYQRVGTGERQAAVDLLSQALGEGYIDLVEFERRVVVVQSATYVGDLVGPTSDLPHQFQWHPQPPQQQVVAPVAPAPPPQQVADVASRSTLSLVLGAVSLPLGICFGIGVVPGVAALLLSRAGLKARPTNASAVTGLILGIFGTVGSGVMLVAFIAAITDANQ